MNKSIKKILVSLVVLLLFTGCSIENISNEDISKNIDIILSKNIKYSNTNAIGYQYYLPTEINVRRTNDFNQELYSNGITYYLYADAVSYYYKVNKDYEITDKAYISKPLSYNGKSGYIEVNKHDNGYFVEIMFNYAKIEALVTESELNETISNMSYILSSVKYNDKIIETLIGDKKYDLSDNETYNIFKSKKKTDGNFLKYENEYGDYKGNIESLIEKDEINQKDN